MAGKKQFYRKAYLRKFPERGIIKYPAPPTKPENNSLILQLLMSLAPMSIMLVVSIIMWVKTGSFPLYMLMFVVMIILQPINAIYNRSKSNKRYSQEVDTWKNKVKILDQEYDESNKKSKRLLEQCFHSPTEYSSIAKECNEVLWSTMPNHEDFAIARLGIYSGSFFIPELSGSPTFIDESIRDVWASCESKAKSPTIDNTPFTYDFIKKGYLGICGDAEKRYQVLASLIAGMAVRQGYDVFHIALITNKESLSSQLEYMKWFPHIWNNDNTRRLIALNEQDLQMLYNEIALLNKIKVSRKSKEFLLCIVDDKSYMLSSELFKAAKENSFGDFLSFVFVEESKSNLPSVCSHIFDIRPVQKRVLTIGKSASKVKYRAPKRFAPANGTKPLSVLLNRPSIQATYYDQQGMTYDKHNNICGTTVIPDLMNFEEVEKIARELAGIAIIDSNDNADIPSSIGFLGATKATSVSDLHIEENWNENYVSEGVIALIGNIGKDENLYTDFSDGINMHMIVTGTSGSGKSQFLTSMILSMMVNYNPDEMNFVFMDFKGNAFSSLFAYNNITTKELMYPEHIVGSISNIESGGTREITRIRVMLKKEISRREKILSDAAASGHIHEGEIKQYQKALREKKFNGEKLPILIIVIDEFVELIESHREITDELNAIARKGRSLGMHLVLSAQKISGKLPAQISANANARICFRVLDLSDSNEMIGIPDAALINPRLFGRGYAKISGTVKEFQTPWTGMRYVEKSHSSGVYDVDPYGVMAIIDETCHSLVRIRDNIGNSSSKGETKRQLSTILDSIVLERKDSATLFNMRKILLQIHQLVRKEDKSITRQIKGMCDDIERRLNVTELQEIIKELVSQKKYSTKSVITSSLPSLINNFKLMKKCEKQGILKQNRLLPLIPIGESDNVYDQSHVIAQFDYLKGGWVIRGIENSGKTQFLATLIYNTCYVNKSCREINIYICDLQGSELSVFTSFPQVSHSIIDSPEKLIRFAYALKNIVSERLKLFGGTYNDWQNYCQVEQHIPALVVIIDNYDFIVDNYAYILEELFPLMEYGKKYGIFFVISTIGKSQGLISVKTPNYLNRIIFMQPKDTDYSSLLAVSDIKALERIRGRCFISGSTVLETQIAYLDYEDRKALVDSTSQMINQEISDIKSFRPIKIEEMMRNINLSSMAKRCASFKQDGRLFIGLDCMSILPFYMDCCASNYFALTSDSLIVRKKFLKSIVTLNIMLSQFEPSDIVIISTDSDFESFGCEYVDITKFTAGEEIMPLIERLSSSFHIVITDNLTQTASKLKTLKGVYDLFRDYLYSLYSHERDGFWINSIADSSFKRGSDFENWAISISEFAAQLSQPSNVFIQVAYKNDDSKMTPRAIDRTSLGKALPPNQAWVRENGQYWRILYAD